VTETRLVPEAEAAHLIREVEANLRALKPLFPDCSLAALLGMLDLLHAVKQVADGIAGLCANAAGELFPDDEKSVVVAGIQYDRARPPTRTGWRKDELRERVKDAVRTDEGGALVAETEFEKVLRLFPLGTPRLGALDEYGIDRDEFCTVTWPEQLLWKITKNADKQRRRK
jgi:hypothetical protein